MLQLGCGPACTTAGTSIHVKFRPSDNLELIGAYLLAWPDKPDGTNVLCKKGDEVNGKAGLYEL